MINKFLNRILENGFIAIAGMMITSPFLLLCFWKPIVFLIWVWFGFVTLFICGCFDDDGGEDFTEEIR